MSDEQDVLIITQFYPPESMGGAHRWEKISEKLDGSINPRVLTTFPTFPFGEFPRRWKLAERGSANDVPVTRLFTYQPSSNSNIGRILNYSIFSILSTIYILLNFWRYDCIITMSAPHTTFIPGLIGKLLGCEWYIDIFDLWIDNAADLGYISEDSISYTIVDYLERLSFEFSDRVLVITETMEDYYNQKYPSLTFETHVVPFGVDTSLFSPDTEPVGSTDIIYTGNLGTGQAFRPFLKAISLIDGEPTLTIVGDGERTEELKLLAKELDIRQQVEFLGYRPREEIPGRLAGASVSIVPLKTEYSLDYACPTKLLESMSVGTPYVASSVDEIVSITSRHQPGITVPNEPTEIAEAIKSVLSDSDSADRYGYNGITLIQSNFDWDEIGDSVSKILSS